MSRTELATDAAPAPRRRGWGWLGFFLGLAILIATGTAAFWWIMLRPVEKASATLADGVRGALQKLTSSEVHMSGTTATVEKSNIAVLSTVRRKTQTIVKYKAKWLGSEKTLVIRGDFLVEAGFDLTKPFKVDFNETTGAVAAEFPPAHISRCEMISSEVLFADDGLINNIQPEDSASAQRQLLALARLEAEKSDIKAEAEAQLKQRLQDMLGNKAKTLDLKPSALP